MVDGGSDACVIGIDIGGTFTDVVLADANGIRSVSKRLTTPGDAADAAIAATRDVLIESGTAAAEIQRVVHGTTLATNTILEHKGGRVAFVTTLGFRHLLALGRHARVESERFNLAFDLPSPPVELALTFEVTERIGPRGDVVLPLDEESVATLADTLAPLDLDGIAVCLLHSHTNPVHELRVGELLRGRTDTPIVLSYDISPEIREFERATTTVMSALVAPVMARYLGQLESRLHGLGIAAPLYIMESAGGILSVEQAVRRSVATVESGPAAGVMAAQALGAQSGVDDVVAFDMGGTTAKAAVITGGRPGITHEFQVGGHGSFGSRRSGTGVPIRVPTMDLAEVGAGGGSIAWRDVNGTVHVGPQSSGAVPGPACYGRGGVAPTVTDADVVLGYLDLSSAAELHEFDPTLARTAIEAELAQPLGVSVETAAAAVFDIANAMMSGALHVVTVQRGVDPRRYALVTSGGAGPLHAARVAERFGIAQVLVPPAAGVASAVGLLTSDLRSEQVRAMHVAADEIAADEVEGVFRQMEEQGAAELGGSGDRVGLVQDRAMDVRYRRQAYHLTIALPGQPFSEALWADVVQRFFDAHQEAFGTGRPGPVELINLRVSSALSVGRVPFRRTSPACAIATGTDRHRLAWSSIRRTMIETSVVDRAACEPEHRVRGPILIEDREATVLVPDGWSAFFFEGGTTQLDRDPVTP
jgi:N-methylhydantoinase A